jgi:ribosomal protein S3
VPFDFHRSIIGQKGRDVRELMEKYDVHIVLSPADQKLDIIKVSYFGLCAVMMVIFLTCCVPNI